MRQRNVEKNTGKRQGVLLLTAVLLIQLLALVYIARQKEGMHIDENYSYMFSNTNEEHDPDILTMWGHWQDGERFGAYLSVDTESRFSYRDVYEINEKDAHPPLFYYFLHTVCSLFPGEYSPWLGMGMNIVLILLSQIALFRLGKKIMGNSLWAVVPVAIYGGMQLFVDTALFIRMYALLTFLTVLLAEQHYHLITSDKKEFFILRCFALTFLGTFTQYYFAVTAFFMAAATCIFFLIRKQWKYLFTYAAAMLSAVICVFLVFPAGIAQITGSETNNVGVEVAANILNLSGLGAAMKDMLWQILAGMFVGLEHCLLAAVLLALATTVISAWRRPACKDDSGKIREKQCMYFTAVLSVIIAMAVVAITHISSKFIYVRYLYNLVPLVALVCGLFLWLIAGALRLNRSILAFGIIAVWLVSTGSLARNSLCSYLFTERTARNNAIMEECADKPVIVLNNGTIYQVVALLDIIINTDQLYIENYNVIESMDEILEQVDCSRGVVYFVLTDTYWSEGFVGTDVMNEVVEQSENLDQYSYFGECDHTTIYMAFPG